MRWLCRWMRERDRMRGCRKGRHFDVGFWAFSMAPGYDVPICDNRNSGITGESVWRLPFKFVKCEVCGRIEERDVEGKAFAIYPEFM